LQKRRPNSRNEK